MFLGLSSAVGRLLSGRLCDVKCINIQYVNQLAIAITGMATVLLPLARTFVSVAFYTVVFGFADGAFMTTQNVILLSIVGPERRATAFGFGNMLCAFAVASGPPLAGEWLPQGGLQGYREKSANTVVKYQQPHGFLLKRREMTGFEIQTKDICKPPPPPCPKKTSLKCQCIEHKSTNWGHYCDVSFWRWDHLFYVVIHAMQRSSNLQCKGSTFISRLFWYFEYWSSPGNWTHNLLLCNQALYWLS